MPLKLHNSWTLNLWVNSTSFCISLHPDFFFIFFFFFPLGNISGQGRAVALSTPCWHSHGVIPTPGGIFHLFHHGSSGGGCGGVKHPLRLLFPFSWHSSLPKSAGIFAQEGFNWSIVVQQPGGSSESPKPPQTAFPG